MKLVRVLFLLNLTIHKFCFSNFIIQRKLLNNLIVVTFLNNLITIGTGKHMLVEYRVLLDSGQKSP